MDKSKTAFEVQEQLAISNKIPYKKYYTVPLISTRNKACWQINLEKIAIPVTTWKVTKLDLISSVTEYSTYENSNMCLWIPINTISMNLTP
jgi:hypothetical protein